ncbi:MAG: hypothetical protein SGI77_08950 [Pirellulaceae bacterium]|nr:hypothetical protein [Pirellulaceae bacterium]
MRSIRSLAATLVIVGSQLAFLNNVIAHPGHELLPASTDSAAHYAFEPVHGLPAIAAGVVLLLIIRWIARRRWRQQYER